MTTSNVRFTAKNDSGIGAGVARGPLYFMWQALRLPAFSFLIILEPPVRFTLSTVALLSVLTAFFFRFLGTPHFPFLAMLGFGVGCIPLLMAYQAAIRLLSR
jgi:hypothetical protein